jgi:multicomponent Na+:H+ antiporter subunit B
MKIGDSAIFRAVGSGLFFLVNIFSVYLLLRGHNLPGGGFIGGLGSALSLILISLAFGVEYAQRLLRVDPVRLAAAGLVLAVLTALLPLLWGDALLKHYHVTLPLLGGVEVGTPLVFDLGVFLAVIGVTSKLVFSLARPNAGLTALSPSEWRDYAAPLEEPIERNLSGQPGEDAP